MVDISIGDNTVSAQAASISNSYSANPNIIYGPKGEQGERGEQGESAYQSWLNEGNIGTELDFLNSLKGAKGDTGNNATINIGTTTTLQAGSNATVTNVGTADATILNFAIPKGTDGTGTGDMLKSIYDPANGNNQVAFQSDLATEITNRTNAESSLNTSISNVATNLTSETTRAISAEATKLNVSDTTVTKQGNTFNGASQLVQLDTSGKIPAVDGSLLTGIVNKDLSNITSNAKTNLNTAGIRTVIDIYTNGTSWYRVYSDGWIEQGGVVTLSANPTTITLLKYFKNANYTAFVGLEISGGYLQNAYVSGKGTTALYAYTSNNSGGYTYTGASLDWYACGY